MMEYTGPLGLVARPLGVAPLAKPQSGKPALLVPIEATTQPERAGSQVFDNRETIEARIEEATLATDVQVSVELTDIEKDKVKLELIRLIFPPGEEVNGREAARAAVEIINDEIGGEVRIDQDEGLEVTMVV